MFRQYGSKMLILVLALALCAGVAYADETVKVDHDPLAVNAEWIDGEMRPNEYHYFPFTVDQVGKVTVRVQAFYPNAGFDLLDADLISQEARYLNGTQGAPDTTDFEYYLEPGLYYLRCMGTPSSTGDFRVKVLSEPCACDETGENDDYHGAQALSSGVTVSGVLTEWDEYDYYSFTLPEETQVRLVVNSEVDAQQALILYDGDMVSIEELYDLHGYAGEFLLPAGTYYAAISMNPGPYTLKVTFEGDSQAAVPAPVTAAE
ncbi:MAG TPA: hypothetical protein IAA59_07650 [Candidatus Faecaligallichristensenella faecipullorum]|nr:hypothetical protein [Candidatus Faecaligallichristensenella faecipullorum]